MAVFTLKSNAFPPGTTVNAYAGQPPQGDLRAGGPTGTSVSSGTMTAVAGAQPYTGVQFTGLIDGAAYYAAAQVSSVWTYVPFIADVGIDAFQSNNLLRPAAGYSETMSRNLVTANNLALTSGTLRMAYGLRLKGGYPVSSISLFSGTTAAGTPTAQWFCLYSAAGAKLAVTNDDTTTAWAANALKTLSIVQPYIPPDDATVYVGCMVAATTPPSLSGPVATVSSAFGLLPPIIGGNSTGSLTTPSTAPATMPPTSAPTRTSPRQTAPSSRRRGKRRR